MLTKTQYRVIFTVLLLIMGTGLAAVNIGFVLAGDAPAVNGNANLDGKPVAEPTSGATVITSEADGYLTVIGANGTVQYHATEHDLYYDVDPVGENTVVYAAVDRIDTNACSPTTRDAPVINTGCSRQVIEKANLETGETTVLYERTFPRRLGAEWHDIDRLSENRYLIGDMYSDRAIIVDTENDVTRWAWSAQADYNLTSGGTYPDDWTHLNDVEHVEEDTYMLSLRNQDQVVFVDRETGLNQSRTLGEDGNHDVLYEQHNPDYLHGEQTDSVLVADSENNRVIEYAWQNGSWTPTWGVGDDTELAWPRDADRLPNGDTLITDTHNNRVMTVDQDGDVVWSVETSTPYEAERLGTGDESAGGDPIQSASSPTPHPRQDGPLGQFDNGINYTGSIVGFYWLGLYDVFALIGIGVVAFIWVAIEWRWSRYKLRLPVTEE